MLIVNILLCWVQLWKGVVSSSNWRKNNTLCSCRKRSKMTPDGCCYLEGKSHNGRENVRDKYNDKLKAGLKLVWLNG